MYILYEMTKDSAKRRILVVDDSPDITLMIKIGLKQNSLFQVDTFDDPKPALLYLNLTCMT
jgi:DNA-binding response OmpR family regulator